MTKKRLLRFSPYLTFLFCYGLVTIVGLIPGLLYGNEMGYWLLGFWFILPWSALLCTFFAAFLRLPLYPLLPVIAGSWALWIPWVTFGPQVFPQSLGYGLIPAIIGLIAGIAAPKAVRRYRQKHN